MHHTWWCTSNPYAGEKGKGRPFRGRCKGTVPQYRESLSPTPYFDKKLWYPLTLPPPTRAQRCWFLSHTEISSVCFAEDKYRKHTITPHQFCFIPIGIWSMPSWDFEFIVTLQAPSRSKQPTLTKEPVGLGRYTDCRIGCGHVASFTFLERTCSWFFPPPPEVTCRPPAPHRPLVLSF